MGLWETIAQQIAEATGEPFTVQERRGVGGGCINSAYRIGDGGIGDGGRRFFVKTNEARLAEMFEAEADGLREIACTASVRVPEPITWGVADGHAFLVLENLELGGSGGAEVLGQRLAAMHRVGGKGFGWFRDNTIGTTPQPNDQSSDWISFWRDRRLGFQLELAARNGYGGTLQRKGEALMARFGALFSNYTPQPSLLHGDLWSGNWAVCRDGEPVIFDPAVYYGDREADLAMTELFGGFGPRFYAAYEEAWPLDSGYRIRKSLYNLYHILNHANLFGGGYAGQAEAVIERLLSELR